MVFQAANFKFLTLPYAVEAREYCGIASGGNALAMTKSRYSKGVTSVYDLKKLFGPGDYLLGHSLMEMLGDMETGIPDLLVYQRYKSNSGAISPQ